MRRLLGFHYMHEKWLQPEGKGIRMFRFILKNLIYIAAHFQLLLHNFMVHVFYIKSPLSLFVTFVNTANRKFSSS